MTDYFRPEILERAAEILDRPGYGLCRGYFAATVEDPHRRWVAMSQGEIKDGLSQTGFANNMTEVETIAAPESTHFCIQGLWARAVYEIEGSLEEVSYTDGPYPHLKAEFLREFLTLVRPQVEGQPSNHGEGVVTWNNLDARPEEVQAVLRTTAERVRAEGEGS